MAGCVIGREGSRHANLAAAAPPHNPGFLTVILPGPLGYALYPSAQVGDWREKLVQKSVRFRMGPRKALRKGARAEKAPGRREARVLARNEAVAAAPPGAPPHLFHVMHKGMDYEAERAIERRWGIIARKGVPPQQHTAPHHVHAHGAAVPTRGHGTTRRNRIDDSGKS